MKLNIFFIGLILLAWIAATSSCKKEKATPTNNQAPVAKAGEDTSLILPSCTYNSGILELDASGSFDPEGNAVAYYWSIASGPQFSYLSSGFTSKAQLVNIYPGEYVIALLVRDSYGAGSRDSISVSVKVSPTEQEFDVPFVSTFFFLDNYGNPWGYAEWDPYYDYFELEGFGNFPPIGDLKVLITEYSDTSTLSDNHEALIKIYKFGSDNPIAAGTCSVKFKQELNKGGNAIDGNFEITSGVLSTCGSYVPGALPPLAVTGSLDTNANAGTLRIKGKIYL